MRLLLVEDDRLIGDALRSALRLEGHAVDWVRDAAAARSALASERFDLVLLDLGLPAGGAPGSPADGGGGLGVLSWLRGRSDATVGARRRRCSTAACASTPRRAR